MQKKVAIVIPAYNEEEVIGATINEIKAIIFNNNSNYKFQIIVVDNNSKDNTNNIAKEYGATVLSQGVRGYGAAYKKGLENLDADIIITGDADRTYPFEDIYRFLKIMDEKNLDFINTNRFASLEKGSMNKINYFGNKVLTITSNFFYGAKFNDSQSGMWIFNKKFLKDLNLRIMGNGMSFSQEIKLYALYFSKRKMHRITEIPIRYKRRVGEKKLSAFKDGIDNFVNLISFRKKLKRYVKKLIIHKRKMAVLNKLTKP